MVYESSSVISGLKEKLISYIISFEPEDKNLDKLSYEELLEKYRNIMCIKSDYGRFTAIIQSCIDEYRSFDPDTSLSDIEIIYANNILDPVNFIALLINKTRYVEKKLMRLKESKDFLEGNSYKFYGKEFVYKRMHSGIAKDTIIYTNYLEKCHRIMQIIEEGIAQEHTR